jgi:hypothetical protein
VPASFLPFSAVTAPLHSATEENNGCTYLFVSGEGTSNPQLYPTAEVVHSPTQVIVLHYFDCTSVP